MWPTRGVSLKNQTNRKNAGFTDEERAKFTSLVDAGSLIRSGIFISDAQRIYSWWSYRFSARARTQAGVSTISAYQNRWRRGWWMRRS